MTCADRLGVVATGTHITSKLKAASVGGRPRVTSGGVSNDQRGRLYPTDPDYRLSTVCWS